MIIGSSAIKYYFPDFPRVPKDLDIVGKGNSSKEVEYLDNPILLNYCNDEYLRPDYIYTLKISHLFWNINWEKHIWDVAWLKEKGCKFNKELFDLLYPYWNYVHGKNKRSDLKMSSDKFFDNAITFPIPHDTIHEVLIKHEWFKNQDKPTYSKILCDGAEVEVSEDKWNLLTDWEKDNLVFEEVAVMSIENRFPKEWYYKRKYSAMLKKFIISHAPIWEAIYIIENHKRLVNPFFNYEQFLNNNL